MSFRRLAVVLGFVAVVAATRPVGAAPNWTPPVLLPFSIAQVPTFAFADGGVLFAARIDVAMPVDLDNVSTQLVVARKAPGGEWTDELVLASTPTAVPVDVVLAVAPNGAACLTYTEGTSNDFMPTPPYRWRAAHRSAAGVWEEPVTLFTDPEPAPNDSGFSEPFCAIAPDGTAVAGAAHLEPDDTPEPGAAAQTDAKLDASVRPANGTWQPAQTLSTHNHSVASSVGIGVDDAGNFTVVWRSRFSEGGTSSSGDDRHTILVRRRLAGQTIWNSIEDVTGSDITNNAFFGSRALRVGPSGQAVIAFQYRDADGDPDAFAAVRQDSLHAFAAPEQVVDSQASSSARAVGVGPDGSTHIVYWLQGVSSADSHFGLVKRPPGGPWSLQTPVSPSGVDGSSAGIAFSGADAIAVWQAFPGGMAPHLIQSSRWPANAPSPEAFRDLEQSAGGLDVMDVVSDRAGSVVVFWSTGLNISATAFDGGGPLLVASSVPGGVVAGVPASFSATFVDLWSALGGPPTWDFGDGTPVASGDGVTHVFATAGTFAVTATAVDALGNPGTATFQVAVGECETLVGLPALSCRCDVGLALAACAGQAVPTSSAKRFTAACAAVDAVDSGSGRKARKAAGRAAKAFKKARRGLAGKAGKQVPAPCRAAWTAVLDSARATATALKSTRQ